MLRVLAVLGVATLAAPSKKVVSCPDVLRCCKSCHEKWFCPTTGMCLQTFEKYSKCDVKTCGPTSDKIGREAAKAKRGQGGGGRGGGQLKEKYDHIVSRPMVYTKKDGLVFLVIGDWGGSSDKTPVTGVQRFTAQGMGIAGQRMKPSFVLGLGDNFYPSGVHANKNYQRFKESYEDVYTDSSLQVPWYNCAGNHDWAGKRSIQDQIAYTTKSPKWVMPGALYSFTKHLPNGMSAKFVMFDSLMVDKKMTYTPMAPGSGKNREAMKNVHWPQNPQSLDAWEWLENELSSSKDAYLFLIDHKPVFTICSHGNTPSLVERVPDLMTKYKVSAFFSGHDHCNLHMKKGDNHYILSGASSQAWNVPSWEKGTTELGVKVPFSLHRHNRGAARGSYNSVVLTDTGAHIRTHDHEGDVLYDFQDIVPRGVTLV